MRSIENFRTFIYLILYAMLNTKTVEEYFQEFGKFFNSQGNPLKIPSIHVYTRTDNYYYSPGKSKTRRKRVKLKSGSKAGHASRTRSSLWRKEGRGKRGKEKGEGEGEGDPWRGRRPVCTSNFLFLITDCISGIFACDIRTQCKLTGLNAPADCINLIKRSA